MASVPVFGEYDFLLSSEKDNPDATIWRLKVLTWRERADIEAVSDSHSQIRRALGHALMGWKNWKRPNGEELEIRTQTRSGRRDLTDEMMDCLVPYVSELYRQIANTFSIPEDNAKN